MNIAEIIKQAIFAQNNDSRMASEKILFETLNTDPNGFLKQVLDELLKESNDPGLRQASAQIIRRAILLNVYIVFDNTFYLFLIAAKRRGALVEIERRHEKTYQECVAGEPHHKRLQCHERDCGCSFFPF